MTNLVRKARQHVPPLREYASGLAAVGKGLSGKTLNHPADSHFAFFTVCFSVKQTYHMLSVLSLIDAGQERDAAVIARLMIEGMVLQQWVARDPDSRALLWRRFALVMDYRLLQERRAQGIPVAAKVAEKIRARAFSEGADFLTAKAKKALAAGKPLPPDPFLKRWHVFNSEVLSTDQIFREVGSTEQYRVYSLFSDWVHSNPRGLGGLLSRRGRGYRFTLPSVQSAASALAAGAQALAFALDLLFGHFHLDATPLEDLRSQLHVQLTPRRSKRPI